MNITINNYPMASQITGVQLYQPKIAGYNTKPASLACDTFEYNSTSPVFAGKKINKKESKKIEETLKNIDGLHDPYSDVIMISQKKFKHFQNKAYKRSNSESMNNLMNGYTEHMFPSEQAVFELLKDATRKAKKEGRANNLTYTDILQENLPDAKTRLINDQFNVTVSIREYSRTHLSKNDQKCVEKYLDIIDDEICDDEFRIKPSIKLLANLYDEIDNKSAVDNIIKLSHNFPNTATHPDAFIVKYADKSHEEIAELLISPAQISIEHIKPSSEHGESKGSNYLAASRRMNNYRSSTPLDEMIERYPDIPRQTQRYMDDLIAKINRGGLADIGMTLADVKESLYKESKGRIDVDLSKMNPEITQKAESFKSKVGKLIEHFKSKED